MKRRLAIVGGLLVAIAAGAALVLGRGAIATPGAGDAPPVQRLRVPAGMRVDVYAHPVENARSLALGPEGVVFVGSRRAGKVYALLDRDRDGRAEGIRTVASDLDTPNGVAYADGDLYVAELGRIVKLARISQKLDRPPRPTVVVDGLPDDEHHGWKYLRIGPDGRLYVPVGMPCNVCAPEDRRFGTIMRLNRDGRALEIFAKGIRNTVGYDWHPSTGELWFTDNGADRMGDDRPPDELNHAPRPGMDFGFPRCHGRGIRDPDHGTPDGCARSQPPAVELGAHVAALGMRFYERGQLPARFHGGLFIAQHGSWNRTTPVGYRVVFVRFEGGRPVGGEEPFLTGFLGRDGRAWGRPVDVLVLRDGSLLVSDDEANAVYRVHEAPQG